MTTSKNRMPQPVVCAAITLFGIAACASAAMAGAPPPAKLDTVKLADDLYVVHNEAVPGNVTVLITNEGVLLVDDKFDWDVDNVVAEVRKLTNQPIKYVVNTHYHGDHSGGNAKLQAMGVQVVATERAFRKFVEGNQPGKPTLTVETRASIHLGGKTAELMYFGRSHTDGDLVVYFPAQKVLSTGDMFTFGDATPQLIDFSGGGSARDWPGTLDGALMLDFNTVVPGHGLVTTKAELRKFRDAAAQMNQRVHQMIVDKKSKEDIAAMLRQDYKWGELHMTRAFDGILVELR